MLNIFNLFLFLLALWVLFMISASHISWLYVFFGIIASGLVAVASFRLKLIEEKSELLYLSLGFYRHFFRIFVKNFLSSIRLIIDLAISRKPLHPTLHRVILQEKHRFNPALLMTSFNMSTGLFSISLKDDEIMVHALDENYFSQFDMHRASKSLNNVNDDNLV